MTQSKTLIGWKKGVVIAALAGCLTAPSSASPARDAIALYGQSLLFDVMRNGEKVGFHAVSIDRDGGQTQVYSRFELEIRFLFFKAYEFRYQSLGIWEQGRLMALNATVDDDGETLAVRAYQDATGFKVSGPDGTETAAGWLYPTTHWNMDVVRQTQVINTLTGRVNQVQIKPASRDTVPTEKGDVAATRFDYSGDLETSVWYDDAGRWVKMKFKGRDGSDIEYACRLCQGNNQTVSPL